MNDEDLKDPFISDDAPDTDTDDDNFPDDNDITDETDPLWEEEE